MPSLEKNWYIRIQIQTNTKVCFHLVFDNITCARPSLLNSAHENQIAVLIMRSVPTHMLPTVTQINRKRCEISVQKCSLSEMLVTLNEGQWLTSSSSSSSSTRSQRIIIIIVYQDELGRFPKFRLAAMRLCVQQGVRRTYSRWLVLEYGEPMTNMLHCLLDSSGGAVCGRGKSELSALVETEAVVSGFKSGKMTWSGLLRRWQLSPVDQQSYGLTWRWYISPQ